MVQTSIAGQIFDDANANGMLDVGEGGPSDATVQLRQTGDGHGQVATG